MLYRFSDEELRTYCRQSIETLEMWGRRLVDDLLTQEYGENYFDHNINASIRKKAVKIQASRGGRERLVNCIFFEDLTAIIANPEHFKVFKIALKNIYPHGAEEARFFLEKIIPVRNALSHANSISVRQAEQVICYSHDFIECIKDYYKLIGKERMWNVPTIITLTDSLGNVFSSLDNRVGNVFHEGDTYSIIANIDPSFSREDYTIKWLRRSGNEFEHSLDQDKIIITFSEKDINESLSIRCVVISKKTWHRHDYSDDEKRVNVTVLPRIL